MHWAITEEDMSPRDATGVEGLIIRMEKELRADGTPIEGFRFLNSSAKMLRYSREIEKEVRASPTGACIYTGFQATDKLLAESRRYPPPGPRRCESDRLRRRHDTGIRGLP